MPLCLGRLPAQPHPNTLRMTDYLTPLAFFNPHRKVYREYAIPDEAKQMFGNNRIGDCTCAAMANIIVLTSVHAKNLIIPSLNDVIAVYSAVSGYDPNTDANDNGAVLTDVLEYMRVTGMGGYKFLAWALVPSMFRKAAIDLFGATITGVNLPNTAMDQFRNGQPWEVAANATNEGGHAIISPGYGSAGFDYVTWARWDQKASADWANAYVEEEYVAITPDWLEYVKGAAHGSLNLTKLEEDISKMK